MKTQPDVTTVPGWSILTWPKSSKKKLKNIWPVPDSLATGHINPFQQCAKYANVIDYIKCNCLFEIEIHNEAYLTFAYTHPCATMATWRQYNPHIRAKPTVCVCLSLPVCDKLLA